MKLVRFFRLRFAWEKEEGLGRWLKFQHRASMHVTRKEEGRRRTGFATSREGCAMLGAGFGGV